MTALRLICVCLAGLTATAVADDEKPKPKFTVGEETTYVTGPIDKDGYIDYAAALNERLGKGVTPQNNAAVLLWQAIGPRPEREKPMPDAFFKRLGIEPPPAKGNYFIDLDRFSLEHRNEGGFGVPYEVDLRFDQMKRAARRPWTPEQFPEIAAWLKHIEKPLGLAVEASRRPRYFAPVVPAEGEDYFGGLIPGRLSGMQTIRLMADALAARAMLRVSEGGHDAAWQDLLACQRLGGFVAQGHTLIELLVGVAIDATAAEAALAFLDRAELDPEQIRGCSADLRKLPPMPSAADKVDLGERFFFLEAVTFMERAGPERLAASAGEASVDLPQPVWDAVKRGLDWDEVLRTGNTFYDRAVELQRIPDRKERQETWRRYVGELKEKLGKPAYSLTGMLLGDARVRGKLLGEHLVVLVVPAIEKVGEAEERSRQTRRNLELAFALAAYHKDNGSYPDKLSRLSPEYVNEVPGDLFTGEDLIYRRTEGGYLLYSVGPNGEDDGGRGREDQPPGDDFGVRMPLPETRE